MKRGVFFKKDPFYRGIYKSSFRLLRCSEYTDGCIEQGRKIKNRILSPIGYMKEYGCKLVKFDYFNKSGLNRWVLSSDCCNSHSLILASWPESKMSGTRQPLYSAGRVYTGAAKRLS